MDQVKALECTICGEQYEPSGIQYTCERHDDPLKGVFDVVYDYDVVVDRFDTPVDGDIPSMWKYRPFLPIEEDAEPITLNEGGTDLFETPQLSEALGVEVRVKDDSRNPTASFKDRASSVSVTKARHHGHEIVICASTGNAAASLAGYAARGGLDCRIFVPESAPAGKLAQPLVYGADVLQVQGSYAEAFELSMDATAHYGWYNRNAGYNPYQVEGKRTAGFEIAEQTREDTADWVVVSVGDGCTIAGVWKGLREFEELGFIDEAPRVLGVQAEGASLINDVFHGDEDAEEIAETLADSIAVAKPANLKKAVDAMTESGGDCVTVEDQAILDGEVLLGSTEGLYGEPAASATVAGLERAIEEGIVDRNESVVLLSSGYGLKDTENARRAAGDPYRIDPDLSAVEAIYGTE